MIISKYSKGFTRPIERDGEKTFEYYDNSRLDGLLKLEVSLDYVREYYEYRQDRWFSFIFLEFAIDASNNPIICNQIRL